MESRVHEGATDEAVEPVERIQIPRTVTDTRVVVNAVRKAGKIGADGKQEGDKALPVDSVEIAISSMRVVESGNVYPASFHQPVISSYN